MGRGRLGCMVPDEGTDTQRGFFARVQFLKNTLGALQDEEEQKLWQWGGHHRSVMARDTEDRQGVPGGNHVRVWNLTTPPGEIQEA